MKILSGIFRLFKDSLLEFFSDRASIYAAGLAYYTLFSLAPLLVFITSLAGLFIGRANADEQIALQLQYIVGPDLAEFIGETVTALTDQTTNRAATLISIVVLIFGGSGIFRSLKTAINLIWGIVDVRPKNAREWLILVRYRAIPFLMVFLFGFLLSLLVILEAILSTVSARFEVLFPELGAIAPQISLLLLPVLTFITFLLIFKFLPDADSRWRDVAVGALVTTLLFLIGRALLSVFLSFSNTGSIYGAAGSVVILLFWVYYSAQILLFGAEFTQFYALRYGRPISPHVLAEFIVDDDVA